MAHTFRPSKCVLFSLFSFHCSILFLFFRDGQLKREKLKPSFLEEQQQKYSRQIIGVSAGDGSSRVNSSKED